MDKSMTDAMARYSTAKGYFQSAFVIQLSLNAISPPPEILTLLSRLLLSGFALELYLKSVLLHDGFPPEVVRKFGHDIEALYQEVFKRKLLDATDLHYLVQVLAERHKDLEYRYMSVSSSFLVPEWERFFDALSVLDRAVDNFIGASASVGLVPGH